ncbi:NADH dehydrogenase subunit 4L [Tanacetum coccineum]
MTWFFPFENSVGERGSTRYNWLSISPLSSLSPQNLNWLSLLGYPTELDGSTSHPLPRGEYELELDQAHCSPAMRKNAYFESSKDLLNSIRGILLNRRNIPIMSMPIESMLLAVNSNFLVFSVSSDDMMGQSFASLVPTVAAAESAIGVRAFLAGRAHPILKSFPKPLPVQLLKDREKAF